MPTKEIRGTVTLHLANVTPVIRALCAGYPLHVGAVESGQLKIEVPGDGKGPLWSEIVVGLRRVSTKMGAPIPDDASLADVLHALATKFPDPDNRAALIAEDVDYLPDASWNEIFELACAFDDDHGLTAMRCEHVYLGVRDGKLDAFGVGTYVTREVRVERGTYMAAGVGEQLADAARHRDVRAAAALARAQMKHLLDSIRDTELRAEVQRELGYPGGIGFLQRRPPMEGDASPAP